MDVYKFKSKLKLNNCFFYILKDLYCPFYFNFFYLKFLTVFTVTTMPVIKMKRNKAIIFLRFFI
ncbi:MAG: hypothetical protein COZ16_06060 [Flavobacteriaceae bacterium CG_4_10_14_3_um_filter_31_253]|nr:MAG: hypothetical protein AUK46_12015 [Flavobacteriaceae bacterium CG2_30_31_66]PIV96814.1 MAG: hypothetical protein COW43_06625 [Flavobacteriaceae bacterium CG17_big_fil_post_rev_8_21_14_2_50_31_13]PIX12690.1 MAG: hypothetical protein COZ74_10165 [Flavobacteriaceae bacterium CG_4_8_14_3_um_filter_31_8]PIY15037.1 MAG: hypothetical protein COZ16_06060 [Flavobacteriaceae bacterium CG_4_10_14_3_um_filter_31_253]PIZ11450.1 MAG: hypothetical protein COY55_04550 [Flavobacteriaceae bacterium CG_4_1